MRKTARDEKSVPDPEEVPVAERRRFKGGFCGDDEGRYAWAYDEIVLSFKVLRDRYLVRRAEVDLTKWKREP